MGRSRRAHGRAAGADHRRPRAERAGDVRRQPAAFNALGVVHLGALGASLGIRKTFGSGTQDCANELDPDLRPGVVAMVHGWGHRATPRESVAHAHPATNPNVLLPSGPGGFEPISSQAHMTGIPVEVVAVPARADGPPRRRATAG